MLSFLKSKNPVKSLSNPSSNENLSVFTFDEVESEFSFKVKEEDVMKKLVQELQDIQLEETI